MRPWTAWMLVLAFVLPGPSVALAAKGAKPKKSPEARFARLDKDGDKKLSMEEFIGKRKDDKKEKAKKQFGRLDKDDDAFLSLEEFKSRRKKKDA